MPAKAKILVIEGDGEKRQLLGSGLRHAGYDVRPASSGHMGLKILTEDTEDPTDLVLLSASLPDINALEVCRRIKAAPAFTPVIMTSQFCSSAERLQCLESGADACVAQPFELREIILQIDALVRVRQSAAQLRANREHLQFLLSTLTDAYFAVSPDWRILELNPVAEHLIFHRPKEELIGKVLWDFCPEPGVFLSQYERAFRDNTPVHFEAKGCWEDLWFEVHAYPAGERLDVYGRDITARKRQEEELRMTQFTLEQAGEPVFWIDTSARIIYVNEAACQSVGYTREEMLQLTIPDLDPLFPAARWPQHWQELREFGQLRFESLHRRKTGETFPVEISANYVLYGGREFNCAFSRDISDRKRAEEDLHRQIDRLKLLNHSTAYLLSPNDPVTLVRGLYDLIAESLEVDALIEYEYREEGRCLRLKTCIGLDEPTQALIACLNLGEALCGTVALQQTPILVNHLDQSEDPKAQLLRDLGFTAYVCHPLISGSKFIGTLAFASRRRTVLEEPDREFFETISRYVALGKERTRLLEKLRRHADDLENTVSERTARLQEMLGDLEHFSYAITHDMRAPLRTLAGFAEVLLREYAAQLPALPKDYLERIHTSAHRMDALITDALQYSRAIRQQLALSHIEPAPLLRGMIQSYPNLCPTQARIEIIDPIPAVLANAAGLTQCFSNLLSNAVKFVKPGETPHVRVWAETRGDFVRVWFEDNGIGIPVEYQTRIFDMFQRLNEDYDGTGIGLALVRKVSERMGGRVGVESMPGAGSRFWMELCSVERKHKRPRAAVSSFQI